MIWIYILVSGKQAVSCSNGFEYFGTDGSPGAESPTKVTGDGLSTSPQPRIRRNSLIRTSTIGRHVIFDQILHETQPGDLVLEFDFPWRNPPGFTISWDT